MFIVLRQFYHGNSFLYRSVDLLTYSDAQQLFFFLSFFFQTVCKHKRRCRPSFPECTVIIY